LKVMQNDFETAREFRAFFFALSIHADRLQTQRTH